MYATGEYVVSALKPNTHQAAAKDQSDLEIKTDRARLKVLNDFAIEVISILDESELAWHVAREVVSELGFVDCVVYFLDEKHKVLRQAAATGSKNPQGNDIENLLEIPVGEGITGHVVKSGKAIIVDDLAKDPRYIADLELARSEIGVPLLYGDVVMGVIDCEHPEPHAFGLMHMELLTTVAAIASSKLELLRKDAVLRKSERNYRAIVEDQTEMISRHSPDGLRTFVNESYCRFHGKPKEELLGRSAYEGMPVDDLARLHEIYEKLTPENPTGVFDVSFEGPDGETVWQRWTKRVIFDEHMQVAEYQAVGHDITESKRAEMDRLQALDEAKLANNTKSEFLAAMSHELRTPLNAILGFSDVLSREYLGPIGNEKYLEYARDIRASGEYLLSLVNDLLDISSIEAGKTTLAIESLEIAQVISESISLVANKAEDSGVRLSTDIASMTSSVYADPRSLRQIILNLLTNALKFTPAGGEIGISAEESDAYTIIKVWDTGIGIPTNRLAELTKPFTQVQRDPYQPVEGWGLGLAITKSLIDLHQGELEIESTEGEGTSVTVRLPLTVERRRLGRRATDRSSR